MGQAQTRLLDRKPQPGDHIYSRRKGGLFYHHGIYVGDDMVIHLLGKAKKIRPSDCQKCRNKGKRNGEIAKTCLDCFLDGQPLQFVEYGESNPPHEVIKTATDLLENNGFGRYNVFANNCDDFAAYCKTKFAMSMQIWNVVEGAATGIFDIAEDAAIAVRIGASVVLAGVYVIAKVITESRRRRKNRGLGQFQN